MSIASKLISTQPLANLLQHGCKLLFVSLELQSAVEEERLAAPQPLLMHLMQSLQITQLYFDLFGPASLLNPFETALRVSP